MLNPITHKKELAALRFPPVHDNTCVPVAYANMFDDVRFMEQSTPGIHSLTDEIMLLSKVTDNTLNIDVLWRDMLKRNNGRAFAYIATCVDYIDKAYVLFFLGVQAQSATHDHLVGYAFNGKTQTGIVIDAKKTHFEEMTLQELTDNYEIYNISIVTNAKHEVGFYPKEAIKHFWQ